MNFCFFTLRTFVFKVLGVPCFGLLVMDSISQKERLRLPESHCTWSEYVGEEGVHCDSFVLSQISLR